jgi:hypothetical protein
MQLSAIASTGVPSCDRRSGIFILLLRKKLKTQIPNSQRARSDCFLESLSNTNVLKVVTPFHSLQITHCSQSVFRDHFLWIEIGRLKDVESV